MVGMKRSAAGVGKGGVGDGELDGGKKLMDVNVACDGEGEGDGVEGNDGGGGDGAEEDEGHGNEDEADGMGRPAKKLKTSNADVTLLLVCFSGRGG